jgi:ubiquinone/menaquinone biosynthesis C-methylase UbiE
MRRRGDLVYKYLNFFTKPNALWLDVGCADGLIILEALKKIRKKIYAIGVEISNSLIVAAKNLIDSYKFEIQMILSDAENLPFSNEVFDFISCTAVLEHLSNVDKVLFNFHKILNKDGTLLITIPNPILSLFAEKIRHIPSHRHKYLTVNKLLSLIKSNKFHIIKINAFMLFPFKFPMGLWFENLFRKIFGTKISQYIMSGYCILAKKSL